MFWYVLSMLPLIGEILRHWLLRIFYSIPPARPSRVCTRTTRRAWTRKPLNSSAPSLYACMCEYTHTNARTHAHTRTHTCIHTCMHVYMHACMHEYIHTYIHTYLLIHTYDTHTGSVHMCLHSLSFSIYTYTYIQMFTHVSTYRHTRSLTWWTPSKRTNTSMMCWLSSPRSVSASFCVYGVCMHMWCIIHMYVTYAHPVRIYHVSRACMLRMYILYAYIMYHAHVCCVCTSMATLC